MPEYDPQNVTVPLTNVFQGFAQWPITVAQTIVMYNLPTSIIPYGTLNLTHEALCDIWTGGINMWNDSRLVANNPALASVNHTLTVRSIVPSSARSH